MEIRRNSSTTSEVSERGQIEIEAWRNVSQRISSEIASIYYPCCGKDRTIGQLFPLSGIVYLDKDGESFQNEAPGIQAVGDANLHVCDPQVDLGVLKCPSLFPKGLLDSVRKGGYLLVDNYHGSASFLRRIQEVELIGRESISEGKWLPYDLAKNSLDGVESDTEWKKKYPVGYQNTFEICNSINHRFEGVLGRKAPKNLNLMEWYSSTYKRVQLLKERWAQQESSEYQGPTDINYELYLQDIPSIPKKEQEYSETPYLFRKKS